MKTKSPSFALVLETNNLRGGSADQARTEASLERLALHLARQTKPPRDLDEIVITHDGLSARAEEAIVRALGAPVRFVPIAADVGYYEAKNRGFDATSADVVLFADADCIPDAAWLERMLAPFNDASTSAVAGRTTYRDDVLGAAATAIDFMYFEGAEGEGTVRNFYANNVAFRREVFGQRRYRAAHDVYRGHCQDLGIRLAKDGVAIRFAPGARTVHRFPDSAAELVRLRLLRGADTVAMAPKFADAVLPAGLKKLGRLGTASALGVLGVRLALSAHAVGKQDMTPVRGAKKIACYAGVAAISAADVAGALLRGAGKDLGARDGGLAEGALSYHAAEGSLAA